MASRDCTGLITPVIDRVIKPCQMITAMIKQRRSPTTWSCLWSEGMIDLVSLSPLDHPRDPCSSLEHGHHGCDGERDAYWTRSPVFNGDTLFSTHSHLDFPPSSEVATMRQTDGAVHKLKPRSFHKSTHLRVHSADFHPGVNCAWQAGNLYTRCFLNG